MRLCACLLKIKFMNEQKGTVKILRHESEILKNNPLGDQYVRDLYVYLPPDYEERNGKNFPIVYCLTGFTGRGKMLFNDSAFSPNLAERMDKLDFGRKNQADDCRDARLFYLLRRLAVYQFERDGRLRRLFDEGNRAVCR